MVRTSIQENAPTSVWSGVRWVRFTAWLIAGAIGLVALVLAWHRTEEFLIKDDRFRIPEAEEFVGQSPNLTVEGVHYASPSQIRHIFAEDFGRSLYLAPIQLRRQQLLAVDWVEEASVAKVWPNSLKVGVRERKPVAFVRFAGGQDGTTDFALIDRDGIILRPRVAARFTLPVIVGVREQEAASDRKARVHRVLEMLQAIGSYADQISEIDVSEPNNLVIAEHVDGGVVRLMLGDEKYSERLKNFLANYAEIKAKRPDAKKLDLRVDGAILAAGGV